MNVLMRAYPALAALCCAMLAGTPVFADEPEVHGSGDAYSAPGVTLAWGILHGKDDASTQVVLRIAVDPKTYPMLAVAGRNPFGAQERVLRPPSATTGSVDVRVARTHFSEFPRTELRFYAQGNATTPALVVFYLGVPDTTPELPDEARLDAYLADRIARARASGPARTP